MNKTLIALAVAAVATNASAVELYNNNGTTFDIGGHVSVGVEGSEERDTAVNAVSPRINFNATHDIGHGFVVDAKGEWALNYLNGGETAMTTRLGYGGITHESYGRAVVGTQWAPQYNVSGVADKPIAFANDFIYDDHGSLGTGRADKMLSYSNALDLADAGTITFGAGWQGAHTNTVNTESVDSNGDVTVNRSKDHYGQRAQVALTYLIQDFSLGYAHNTGKVKNNDVTFNIASATYGTYGKGLYVAGVYQIQDGTKSDANDKLTSQEALLAYAFDNSLNLSVNYEMQKTDSNSYDVDYATSAIQAEYNFTKQFVGYAGYEFELDNNTASKEGNHWMFGARYYL